MRQDNYGKRTFDYLLICVVLTVAVAILLLVLHLRKMNSTECGISRYGKLPDEVISEIIGCHDRLSYGAPISSNINDVLKDGTGACGELSFLLWYRLSESGYKTEIIGTHSTYKNANHAVVQIEYDSNWYTLDPTNNCYYPWSVDELINSPDLSKDIVF